MQDDRPVIESRTPGEHDIVRILHFLRLRLREAGDHGHDNKTQGCHRHDRGYGGRPEIIEHREHFCLISECPGKIHSKEIGRNRHSQHGQDTIESFYDPAFEKCGGEPQQDSGQCTEDQAQKSDPQCDRKAVCQKYGDRCIG